jgi:hypothetical protein
MSFRVYRVFGLFSIQRGIGFKVFFQQVQKVNKDGTRHLRLSVFEKQAE